MDSISVVIPTFNRATLLKKVLQGYLVQSAAQSICEIIVVDDGSTDDTAQMVQEIAATSPFPVRYLYQPNKGPAAARNRGIQETRANLILFTDSDIVPDTHLIQQHVDWHRNHPDPASALLGYVTWPPEPAPTPFMRWYGEHGAIRISASFSTTARGHVRMLYTATLV